MDNNNRYFNNNKKSLKNGKKKGIINIKDLLSEEETAPNNPNTVILNVNDLEFEQTQDLTDQLLREEISPNKNEGKNSVIKIEELLTDSSDQSNHLEELEDLEILEDLDDDEVTREITEILDDEDIIDVVPEPEIYDLKPKKFSVDSDKDILDQMFDTEETTGNSFIKGIDEKLNSQIDQNSNYIDTDFSSLKVTQNRGTDSDMPLNTSLSLLLTLLKEKQFESAETLIDQLKDRYRDQPSLIVIDYLYKNFVK